MTDDDVDCRGLSDLRDRLTRQGEETMAKVIEEMLESSLVRTTLSQLLEARDRATRAQEAAYGALNIPSAADLERLTRRVRSLSQRLEGIEDGVDRIAERLATVNGSDVRLRDIEKQLGAIVDQLAALGVAGGAAKAAPKAKAKAAPKAKAAAARGTAPRKP